MCKSRLFLCSLGVLSLSLFGLPASAQTPVRQTPAVEGECSVLKQDWVTKGLFGLCVAFCKAHGSAGASPGRTRVLDNYNKLMKVGIDPPMPCLQSPVPSPVAQPCPCWTAAQAGAVDGVLSDNSPASGWSTKSGMDVCAATSEFAFINESSSDFMERTFIRTANVPSQQDCQYLSMIGGAVVANKWLWVQKGELTQEELAACTADVLERQAALGICP